MSDVEINRRLLLTCYLEMHLLNKLDAGSVKKCLDRVTRKVENLLAFLWLGDDVKDEKRENIVKKKMKHFASNVESDIIKVEDELLKDINIEKTNRWAMIHKWIKLFMAELLGTAILVFVGCMGCLPFIPAESYIIGPLSFGLAVFTSIQIFAHISCAYINPAVVILAVLLGLKSVPIAILYIVAELIGGIAGFLLLKALIPAEFFSDGFCTPTVHPSMTLTQGFFMELILTFILLIFCCAVWDPINADKTDSLSIKFGLLITVLSIIGGRFTGTSMNTARQIGPAIYKSDWGDQWIYYVAPNLAPFLVYAIYKFVLTEKIKRYVPVTAEADPATSKNVP